MGFFPYEKPKFAFLVIAENSKNKDLNLSVAYIVKNLISRLNQKGILEKMLKDDY